MLFATFWTTLAQSLGLRKSDAFRDAEIRKHVTNLTHENPDMRRSAAWSLAKMHPPAREAVDALEVSAEKDRDEFVRRSSKWAAKMIRGPKG